MKARVLLFQVLGITLIVSSHSGSMNLDELQKRMKELRSEGERGLKKAFAFPRPGSNPGSNPVSNPSSNPGPNTRPSPSADTPDNSIPPPNAPSPNFDHELPPNAAARFLIKAFGDEIKTRTKRPLHVSGPDQEKELMEAEIQALSFIMFKEVQGPLDIYYMRTIIGKTYIFHVKMSVEYGTTGTGLFGLGGKHAEDKNRNRFTVMQVLGPKEESDRLNKAELA